VADLWKTAALAGKRTVRGKVSLQRRDSRVVDAPQDGTGSASDGSDDISTSGRAPVGDVITVTGIVTVNKDLDPATTIR
jgi:hypothetical protein